MRLDPITLTGRFVRLEPLTLDHVPGLVAVGLEPDLWRWIPTAVTNEKEMREYVEIALEERRHGTAMPFAILDQASGNVIGSTRYANVALEEGRLEIGWTWYTSRFQRTPANTEAKLLLLTHAFEALGLNRVEFKTDALNEKSRRALARIGAVEEGTFRRHRITASGRIRDTVYFSIIKEEWPGARARLQAMLDGGR